MPLETWEGESPFYGLVSKNKFNLVITMAWESRGRVCLPYNPLISLWVHLRVREGDLLGWEKLIDDKLVEENLSINGTTQFGNLLKTCQKR